MGGWVEARESSHPSATLQVELTCERRLIAEPFGIIEEIIRYKRIDAAKNCKVLKRIIQIESQNDGNRRALTTKTKVFPFKPPNTYDELRQGHKERDG